MITILSSIVVKGLAWSFNEHENFHVNKENKQISKNNEERAMALIWIC